MTGSLRIDAVGNYAFYDGRLYAPYNISTYVYCDGVYSCQYVITEAWNGTTRNPQRMSVVGGGEVYFNCSNNTWSCHQMTDKCYPGFPEQWSECRINMFFFVFIFFFFECVAKIAKLRNCEKMVCWK